MADQSLCVVEACIKTRYGKSDYCRPHYRKWKRYGNPTDSPHAFSNEGPCSVDGCEKKAKAKGLCDMHWARLSRNGSTDIRTKRIAKEDGLKRWFQDHVNHRDSECLMGPLARSDRYTYAYIDGVGVQGHRYMCELAHGPAPKDKPMALHSCGNGHLGCVNPIHLRWGSHTENMIDKALHGRTARGSCHGKAKLDEEAVKLIRSSSLRSIDLANLFSVTAACIYNIRTRKTWAHI